MEFEDEDRDEEEEENDDHDNDNHNNEPQPEPEPEPMTLLTPPTYPNLNLNHHHHHHHNNNKKHSAVVVPRYRECLKNHAVNIGGHAVDGCGEFMPAGPDGTFDALKCAACNCHRNFHRKEHVPTTDNHCHLTLYHPPPPHVFQFYRPAAVPSPAPTTPAAGERQLALPATGTAEEQVTGGMMAMTMTTATTTSSGKKRHRTKFSQEQKDKMLAFAERLGWKIQRCDESIVQQFCDESGVKRHVLKVWMHNNKHTLGKKPPC